MRKRKLTTSALFLIFIVFGITWVAEAQTATDEVAIRSFVPNFENAWTKCDARALALLWTEDGDFQSPYDSFAKGRKEIEVFYRGAFNAGYCGSRGTGKIENIHILLKNVAIIDGTWDIQGAHDQNGHDAPEEKGRFTAVLIKRNGAWLIVAQREMIPQKAG